MSFSSEVKLELLRMSQQQDHCCAEAELYGLLLFGYGFSAHEISLRTELKAIADFIVTQVHILALAQTHVLQSGRKWEVTIPRPEDRHRLLERFGHRKDEVSRRIVPENFACDGCRNAFLRGAFLACAAVISPQRQYHLEFSVGYKKLALALEQVLCQAQLMPKLCQRKGMWLLYYKDSEQIEDVLASLGAQMAMLQLVNTKIEKDINNNVNRAFNFEMANIDRTSAAAAEQLHAIEKISKTASLTSLPEHLQEAAALRMQHPESSLQELCALAAAPVTRSGMNHRLKKLIALSEAL